METIKQIMTAINTIIKIPLIIIGVILIIMLYRLPHQIKDATKGAVIYESETVELRTKSEFIYFNGIAQDSSFKMLDRYDYNAKYPEAIYDGYITRFKSSNGSEVFIWSSQDISGINDIDGWFLTDNIGRFGVDGFKNKYLDIIYPVTKFD